MIRERLESPLTRGDGLMCDMDGVLYRGDEPVEGAPDAVVRIKTAGVRVVFCTNNSRSTIEQYRAKLARLGFEVDAGEILTSAVVTADELAGRGLSGASAFVVGGDGLRAALDGAGIEAVDKADADIVVVGWDPSFTYDAMKSAARAVMNGALFVASNDDASFPAPEGLIPGAGAILASIERASGRRAEVMGKPHDPMMRAVRQRLAGAPRVVAVGDRPETDLEGARQLGWTTVLVLTGVTSEEDAGAVDPPPDVILGSIADLVRQVR